MNRRKAFGFEVAAHKEVAITYVDSGGLHLEFFGNGLAKKRNFTRA